MALSVTTLAGQLGGTEIYQSSATGVADANLAAAGEIRVVEVDNTANTSIAYVKLYDSAAPTVGTTAPNWQFIAPITSKVTYTCPNGSAFTNLSLACVTLPGTPGVSPTHDPTNAVTVRIVVT